MKYRGLLILITVVILSAIIGACAGEHPQPVLVTGLTVVGADGRTTVNVGETLRMFAQVWPNNAANKAITWSVENAGGSTLRDNRAEITQAGILTGLSSGAVIVKATAQDGSGVIGQREITVTQPAPQTYILTLNRNPVSGGTVTGEASYEEGVVVTITATPNTGYRFLNWTRGTDIISSQATFNYTMPDENVTLVANFEEVGSPESIYIWNTLLLVYPSIDVHFLDPQSGIYQHYAYQMSNEELQTGIQDYHRFPSLAHNLSEGDCFIHSRIIIVERTIESISPYGDAAYWVSPDDVRTELDSFAPMGTYDSIMVMIPRLNRPEAGTPIPTGWWGLGYWPGDYANGATYGVGINDTRFLNLSYKYSGELWLHEWLHGSCSFFASKGFSMPEKDADGGELHGYTSDPVWGWSIYYKDLMTGRVWDASKDKWTGITPDAWRYGSIINQTRLVFAEYFRENTLHEFRREGTSTWNYYDENVTLGCGTQETSSSIYATPPQGGDLTLTGRVQIPSSSGMWDSISVALKGASDEYWGMLMYGTSLSEKDHIGISKNDGGLVWYPMNLSPGWYTVKMNYDTQHQLLGLKVWADGMNEPDQWQVETAVLQEWTPLEIGLRHFGSESCVVDDLICVR